MQSISTIRYENLLLLLPRFKNAAAFAAAVEMTDAQLWQLRTRKANGSFYRGVGDKVARKIERLLGLPFNWMDQPQDSVTLPESSATARTAAAPGTVAVPGASGIQCALLDTARRLIDEQLLSDIECLALLQSWQPLIADLKSNQQPTDRATPAA